MVRKTERDTNMCASVPFLLELVLACDFGTGEMYTHRAAGPGQLALWLVLAKSRKGTLPSPTTTHTGCSSIAHGTWAGPKFLAACARHSMTQRKTFPRIFFHFFFFPHLFFYCLFFLSLLILGYFW